MNKGTLPRNWQAWPLADVGTWLGGGTPRKSDNRFWHGHIRWVSPKDMKALSIVDTQDHISEEAVENSAAKIIPPGSVLFVTRSGILAHSFPVATNKTEVTVNQDLKAIVPEPVIDTQYLAWCLRAHARLILDSCTKDGTTVQSIEVPTLKAYQVAIAPINEQRRIVAKIEELFSELDKGVENLKTAREQLKVYRQAVFKHAFEGKLTAQWRKEHKDKLESAERLLACIEKERKTHYHRQLDNWNSAVSKWKANGKKGKQPAKPRRAAVTDKPSPEHRRRMWDLPIGWRWLQIGNFAFVTKLAGFEYTKYVRYDDDGDLPVIKAENAGPNGYRVTQYSHVRSASVKELTRSYLEGAELLMVFVGAGTGNVAMVPKNQRFFLGPNIAMIRVEFDAVNARFIELFLRSPMGKDLALAAAKAVAQPSLSMETIRQVPVALPSKAEQDLIVMQIDATLSAIEKTESEIGDQISRAELLRQSILKKAFSGRLVTQDPKDEPASVLLERINAEKTAQNKDNTNKNNKRKDAA